MFKLFFLIFEPGAAWDKIARAQRGIAFITLIYLLPLIALCTGLELWGLSLHGKWQPHFQRFRTFAPEDILTLGIIQFLLLFVVVFVTAVLVYHIGRTFQNRLTFVQAFTTIAYGFSPMFLMRFLDYYATMHPGVTWMLGIGLTIWTLYQGIPRVMQPDPTHAFGVYLSTVMVVILTSGLARLMTALCVLGRVDLQHSWLSHGIGRLLGY